jgi:ABC-type branched-subunit amino acid transport system permease subunit
MTEALITSGILSCIVVIALCGTHALNGIARQMSLAIAPLVGVGYCSMLFFASTTQEDSAVHGHAIAFIPSLALTLIITAVVAVMIGLISFRMRGVGALIPTIISSIIVLFILGETHFNNKGHIRLTKLKLGDVDFHHLSMGGHTFSASTSFLILSVFFALFTMIYTANILRSPLARSMRVVAANESDAKANAISPLSSTLSAYATSGLAAAIAGSLLAYCQHSASLTAVNVWDCAFGIGLSAAIVLI